MDIHDAKKIELLKQHFHELIEAKNKEVRDDEEAQERLRKQLGVILR